MKGGTVCRNHGGKAPQVMKRAKQRLLDAADEVAGHLVTLATDYEVDPAVRVRAINSVLDRAGVPVLKEVAVSEGSHWLDELTPKQLERINNET